MITKPRVVNEIACESALNRLKRRVPYGWDLNIYRGCHHGCTYCYAMYSHGFLNDTDFFGSIYLKSNIVEKLEEELSAKSWRREVINIGGTTDSYQPIEEDRQVMPQILRLLIKYKTPAIISTKSDLILRDYDLIDELSRITYINVAATITTMDEDVRLKIEPLGSPSLSRFEMLNTFRKTNASVGLHVMPIIPFITDGPGNIESICAHAQRVGVHYMLAGTLYLRGRTRPFFLEHVRKNFPEQYFQLQNVYEAGAASKAYKEELYKMVNSFRKKYQVSSNFMPIMKEKLK